MALLGQELSNELMNTTADSGFSPVPAGEYMLQVVKTEMKSTKDGVGFYIKVEFDIIGPAYQGRKLFANFNLRNNSPKAESIGKAQFKQLYTAGHVAEPVTDTDQLLGITVKATVTIREGQGQYGPSNDVKNFKPTDAAVGDAVMPQTGGTFSAAFAKPTSTPAKPNIRW